MKNAFLLSILFFFSVTIVNGQDTDRKIQFPDIKDYKTLLCDFHIHTVFSDGSVWPDIRVDEAVRDGLDAISLTEHIEYNPHSEDIPHPDRNRSYEIAKKLAIPHDLIVVHGVELTRDLPPGHSNAIFIEDANKFKIEDPKEQFLEAQRQGAFVFWNHPNWIRQSDDGIAKLTDMHKDLIKNKLLHGLEVVNDITYSDEALDIATDQNLTVMGCSDVHGLVDWTYNLKTGGHRPISLVFAKERTEASIKEALFAGRTVAWFNNILVGTDKNLKDIIYASLKVDKKNYIGSSSIVEFEISNNSDARFLLKNISKFTFNMQSDIIEILPHSTKKFQLKTLEQLYTTQLRFEVLNAVSGKNKHPEISMLF